jgi:hypothetical protein
MSNWNEPNRIIIPLPLLLKCVREHTKQATIHSNCHMYSQLKRKVLDYGVGRDPLVPFICITLTSKFDPNLAQWSTRTFNSLLTCKILKLSKSSMRERVREIILLKTLLSDWDLLMITQTTIIESPRTTILVTFRSFTMHTPFSKT